MSETKKTKTSKPRRTKAVVEAELLAQRQVNMGLQATLDEERAALAKAMEPKQKRRGVLATAATVAFSIVIPIFTMTTARMAGSLLSAESAHKGVGVFAAVLALTCLAVSLGHLSEAIRLITKSGKYVAGALALAFDGGIILSETIHAQGNVELASYALGMLLVLTMFSMALNAVAFFAHKEAE